MGEGGELRGRGRHRAGRGKREEASRGKTQLRREKVGGEGGELRQVGRDRLTQSREGQEGGDIEGKGTVEGEGVGRETERD